MNLVGVAAYLESKRLGTQGKSIFVNEMPLECEIGVVLRDRYSGTPIDHELPEYRETGFRCGIRSRDYKKGERLAFDVGTALTLNKQDVVMPGMVVKMMLPQNEPRPYRRSKGGFWEWEIDFDTTYVRT
jgi:hypothetical protein